MSASVQRARTTSSSAYRNLEEMLTAERCIVLDGGVATELERRQGGVTDPDPELWGTWALFRAPQAVLDVHRSYVDAGCNVLSTDTWSILSAPEHELRLGPSSGEAVHWMDVARLGIRLARRAIDEGGRTNDCAVAFAISEEINSPHRRGTLELLSSVFAEEPPDLVLLETLTLVRDPEMFETVERLLETGLPVWLSFRRCRHGVCGVFGQHWGPPEGDLFGRAARRFEDMGVGALMINCLPVDHVPGIISWLRDFTDLPLGVYPNLGHLTGSRWRFDDQIDPAAYADLALSWREEGAQIIGGCCGVTTEHIATMAAAVADTKPGRKRPPLDDRLLGHEPDLTPTEPWRDEQGRVVSPLPFPKLTVDEGVFVPTTGSYLVWKTLFDGDLGRDQTCLDVGCGCGILSVQLALNGAERVHAIDIDDSAVANTLANGFRNGVSDRLTGETVDLYQWGPTERFDLIAASLYQMPVDPYEAPSGHRPLDYWGRNLLDHFIRLLPRLLAPDGIAYVMQLSILGQSQSARLLAEGGLQAKVVDFSFFPFGPLFLQNKSQIDRVEQVSDAYHLRFADEDVMVAYLLEVTRSDDGAHRIDDKELSHDPDSSA
ncbi:MAG: homocysteine S-methyltransferase family protein [Actinobacteria bacterium]|nr:homocysteine S-methyltransferase family protein [Actinomycetota bacterium]